MTRFPQYWITKLTFGLHLSLISFLAYFIQRDFDQHNVVFEHTFRMNEAFVSLEKKTASNLVKWRCFASPNNVENLSRLLEVVSVVNTVQMLTNSVEAPTYSYVKPHEKPGDVEQQELGEAAVVATIQPQMRNPALGVPSEALPPKLRPTTLAHA